MVGALRCGRNFPRFGERSYKQCERCKRLHGLVQWFPIEVMVLPARPSCLMSQQPTNTPPRQRWYRLSAAPAVLVLALVPGGCRPPSPVVWPAADADVDARPVDELLPTGEGSDALRSSHLHNLMRVTRRLYSGGEPETGAAFAELKALGVTTVVSVDGAQPQIEMANEHGLRYVHIPIGYDGIPDEAGKSLTRLMRDVEGPIYIHCHHGRHRGPAAAAVACVASGVADGDAALEVLRRAGTSEKYGGLWRDVQQFQAPPEDAELPELVSLAQVDSLTAAMAQIDRAKDHLVQAQQAVWTTVGDHPDMVAAEEALLLREAFRETRRHVAGDYDERFATLLAESETLAAELESAISRQEFQAADKHLKQLVESCQQCHSVYRD